MKLTRLLLIAICCTHIFGTSLLTEEQMRGSIIATATQLLGSPYRAKGSSSKGFDCSGFVNFVLGAHNIKIARSSADIIHNGVEIPLTSVKPGDLLLFKGANKKSSRPGHSAIVHHIDNDGLIHFIHSSSSRGITIDDMDQAYYKNRFLQARDVVTSAVGE